MTPTDLAALRWWTDGAMVNCGLPGDEGFVGDAETPDDAQRIADQHNDDLTALRAANSRPDVRFDPALDADDRDTWERQQAAEPNPRYGDELPFGPEPMTPERAAYLRGFAEGATAANPRPGVALRAERPRDEAWQWVATYHPKVLAEMPTALFRRRPNDR